MLQFRWSRLRRRCGGGAAAIDEAIIGATPWRWRTGQLNRWDDEMDDMATIVNYWKTPGAWDSRRYSAPPLPATTAPP